MIQYTTNQGGKVMEFLGIWLGSCITSFGIEIATSFRMFKDVADAGYKIDIERMDKITKILDPDSSKREFLTMLLPVFNIMHSSFKAIGYNNAKSILLDQLEVLDVLEEMSEIEKQEYQKRPTGLNAILVPLKSELRIAKSQLLIIIRPNFKSKIFYEIGENNDITILKVEGDALYFSLEDQKEIVFNELKEERVSNQSEIVEEPILEETKQETEVSMLDEQIEDLKRIKEDLLNKKDEENFKEEQTKVRKRK